mgnify:CR=1 FL=1
MVEAIGFQPASELGPSASREEMLEDLVRSQAAQIEKLREEGARQAESPGIRPEEKQALVQLLSDLGERIKELELLAAKQARQIEEMDNVNNRLEQQITDVKGLAKDRISELLAEIVDIRNAQKVDRKYVNDLVEELGEAQELIDQHADAINKVWQATKKGRMPTGKKSKARVEQLKEILKGGAKTYKELERILKISPKEMNRLVSMLDTRSYEVFFRAGDNRQKVLRLRSLTSNVKCSEEGDSKGV